MALARWRIDRVAGVAALGLLTWALAGAVRLGYADWFFVKGDPASLRQAIRLAPGTAEYYSALAQADPDHAVETLQEAAAVNPRAGSLRVELGLAAEARGDFADAEASLLDGARLDAGFAPRWALSDFYFHRRDALKFWPVVRDALALSHDDDLTELFRHCWALSSDPRTILQRAIPDRPAILRQYLNFLLTEGRLDAAEPVAHRILPAADKPAEASLLRYCDLMLAADRSEPALFVWQQLRGTESGHGFDWQVGFPTGVSAHHRGETFLLRFSGKQADCAEILGRYVPLTPHRRYILTARYRVSGIAAESGLICSLSTHAGRDLLADRGNLPGGAGELTQTIPFQAPGDITLARLALGYRRALGTTPIEGALTLHDLSIKEAR